VERPAHADALTEGDLAALRRVRRLVDREQLADALDGPEQDGRDDVVLAAPLDRRRAGAERLEQRRVRRRVGLRHDAHALHRRPVRPDLARRAVLRRDRLGRRPVHGQLGLVLPSHDPIRLAEEIAMADHMLRGRLFVGMARGYQSRWMNILCQKLGVGA
jgi:hypothetical protein